MSVSLQKGQKISLTKESSGLKSIMVGLGWDAAPQGKGLFGKKKVPDIDCDAFALLLQGGKLCDSKDCVFFNNLTHYTGTVRHLGDNLTGDGDGDDEQILMDLAAIPEKYDKIILAVNIYNAYARNQHFGMIRNAFIRIVDQKDNRELCCYNLTDNYSGNTAMIFGEIYRYNGEWKFNAIGQGTQDSSITEFAKRYK